ncbi:MAG: hypothetical protein IT318_04105 [Anaerolineales bacterium]|nr:hypothetical protein [Anaerolineales bacterium]
MTTAPIRWNTFVMRLWNDTTSGQWRGEIVHLQTRESRHFASWAQAEAFTRRFVPSLLSEEAPDPKDEPFEPDTARYP